ncbi:CAP domain-containing protein [Paraburkholderia agricolaris]|uniref:CAP domain-containing protein n=1 Tax=Paraburkholderia agricolaris TaxID=2152888 RepID=A0ABW8ZL21_9BURK
MLAATGSSVGSPTLTGDVIADSVAYSSNIRLQLGLTALKDITQVNKAAANHALYMFDANQVGHYETAGQPGYTGVAPADRVAAAGYTTNATGEIAAGIGGAFTSSTQAVDALFDAPFHRAIFLYDTTGVGFGQGPANTDTLKYSTLVGDFVDYVQQTPDYKLVAYPYDGQTNVKPSWVANESPNPMANAPSYINQTVGYPVTLSAAGNGAFSNINFIVTDASGNAVPCQETDNTNNSEATRLAMCVPFKPLASNATYKVTVTGSLTNTSIPAPQVFSVSWSFTTGASAAMQARQLPAGSGSALPTILN